MSGDLTEDFSRWEFACHCGCGFDGVSMALVRGLQELRTAVGFPVSIWCGCRCTKHNRKVGGAANSYHLTGGAADIVIPALKLPALLKAALVVAAFREGGVGLYPASGFVHVDVRPSIARWGYVDGKYTTMDYAVSEMNGLA